MQYHCGRSQYTHLIITIYIDRTVLWRSEGWPSKSMSSWHLFLWLLFPLQGIRSWCRPWLWFTADMDTSHRNIPETIQIFIIVPLYILSTTIYLSSSVIWKKSRGIKLLNIYLLIDHYILFLDSIIQADSHLHTGSH